MEVVQLVQFLNRKGDWPMKGLTSFPRKVFASSSASFFFHYVFLSTSARSTNLVQTSTRFERFSVSHIWVATHAHNCFALRRVRRKKICEQNSCRRFSITEEDETSLYVFFSYRFAVWRMAQFCALAFDFVHSKWYTSYQSISRNASKSKYVNCSATKRRRRKERNLKNG